MRYLYIILALVFVASINKVEATVIEPIDSYSAIGALIIPENKLLISSLPNNQYQAQQLFLSSKNSKINVKLSLEYGQELLSEMFGELIAQAEMDYESALNKLERANVAEEVVWKTGEFESSNWRITIKMPSPAVIVSKLVLDDGSEFEVEHSLINNIFSIENFPSKILVSSTSCGAVSCSTDIFLFSRKN